MFSIPTLIKSGESVMLTTQPKSFWTGPSSSKPTHADFYASFAGADIMEACTKDSISPSGTAMLPYEIGTGVEDNGYIYSTHYLYQQPNSELSSTSVGYLMDLECESKERGVCGPVIYNAGIIKVNVLKRPRSGSTKVKFIFKKPESDHGMIYKEPIVTQVEPVIIRQSDGSTIEYSTLTSTKGRKLKEVEFNKRGTFLRNALSHTVMVCEEDHSRGTSVGPGETIQVEERRLYFIEKELDSKQPCNQSKTPWILSPAVNSSSRRILYSYTVNANTVDFHIILTCTGTDDVCSPVDARHLEVKNKKDSNFSVTYTVKSFSSKARSKSVSYDWGHFLFNFKQ